MRLSKANKLNLQSYSAVSAERPKSHVYLTKDQWQKLGYWGLVKEGGWMVAGPPETVCRARELTNGD